MEIMRERLTLSVVDFGLDGTNIEQINILKEMQIMIKIILIKLINYEIKKKIK